jgi:hypothetical protein
VVGKHKRRGKLLLDVIGNAGGVIDIFEVAEQDDEFIAPKTRYCWPFANAGDEVWRVEIGVQAVGQGDEELIPYAVAQAFIDSFKLIEIEQEHGKQIVWTPLGAFNGTRQAIGE